MNSRHKSLSLALIWKQASKCSL